MVLLTVKCYGRPLKQDTLIMCMPNMFKCIFYQTRVNEKTELNNVH